MFRMTELEQLAREDSSERRRELLRSLTDMFLEGSQDRSGVEDDLFGDVVCRVLDDVVEEARVELAERVAPLTNFPKDVVKKLAEDDITVALPVLQQSPVLSDEDLVEIARGKSQDHLLAISRRETLREAVTDVLVSRGDSQVLHSVTANAGARFSREGFGVLAKRCDGDERLQERLVVRPDMPREVAAKLEPLLTGELKQRLKTMLAMSGEDEFEGYVSRAKSRLEDALKDSRRERLEVRVLIGEVKSGKKTLSDAVTKLAKDNRPVHLGWLIAAVAELPENIVSNTLLKVNGLPLAVTCKALDLTSEAFRALANMRCKRLKLPANEADRLVQQYREIAPADAQRTVRFLKVRHTVQGSDEQTAA